MDNFSLTIYDLSIVFYQLNFYSKELNLKELPDNNKPTSVVQNKTIVYFR